MSSSWPLVKYVDAPAAAATVRYDFNDQNPNLATSPAKKVTEFDPGVPTLEGDPDAVGQQWGFRSPQIVHTIRGTKAQAMAALSAVSKEQLRDTNWVLFQPSAATQPVWFKTYRTGYQPITLDRVYVRVDGGGQVALPDTWKVTVPLVADAFAYGARVVIPTLQVVQGPADLAGPVRGAMHAVLPAIKGDAPTGLRISVTPASTAGSGFDPDWLVGCVAGKATMADTVIDIGTGDGFTAGTNMGAGVANAAYFGGSYRQASIAVSDLSAGSNFAERLTGSFPVVPAGRYKVLARISADAPIGVRKQYLFAFGNNFGSAVIRLPSGQLAIVTRVQYGDTELLDFGGAGFGALTFDGWVDLGDFPFPAGYTEVPDVVGTMPAQVFSLKIGLADNTTGTVRVDAFKLIPVDGPTVTSANLLRANFSFSPLQKLVTGTFDGDSEAYWSTNAGGSTFFNNGPSLSGGFPVADPAAERNLLLLMALDRGTQSGGSPYITDLNSQAAVDVSYYPRYLHIGDGT